MLSSLHCTNIQAKLVWRGKVKHNNIIYIGALFDLQ